MGLMDTGLEGHLECEEQRQIQQAINESQLANLQQEEEVKQDEQIAANPYPSLSKDHNYGEPIPGIPVEEPEIHDQVHESAIDPVTGKIMYRQPINFPSEAD